MTCFRIPVAVCNNIERVCARFWWGDKEKEKKMHWMVWKEMCKPKSRGGMGFKSLIDFNQALLAKQVWRIIKYPFSLVSQLLRAKYFRDGDIMEAKIPSNSSYLWRSLMWGRGLLKRGIRWRVGDGKTVRLFKDAWLPNFHEGRTIQRPNNQDGVRVADLLLTNGEWNNEKLEEMLLPVEVEEVVNLNKLPHEVSDVRYWKFDEKGEYNVKSGYLAATGYFDVPELRSEDDSRRWWKYLWSFDLPPRVRIFVWRVFRDIIPTELNLISHHVPIFGRCGWCRRGWGSTSHALIYCEKVRHFWLSFEAWDILKRWEGFNISEIGEAMKESTSRDTFQLWLMCMWLVWKALCEERYKQRSWPWIDLRSEGGRYIDTYLEASHHAALASRVLPKEGDSRWRKPKRGRFRLDVDYAVEEGSRRGGVGVVVRDEMGVIRLAMAKPISQAVTTLHGELQALVHGIKMCVEEDLFPIEVYTDSMLAVLAVAEEEECDSVLGEDFFDFFIMVKKLNVISINHMGRDANGAAHSLARFARSLDSDLMWSDNWPSWLINIVSNDLE